MPASVVDAVRIVWPRYAAHIVGCILGRPSRTVENRLQKRGARDEWDDLVKLMAESEDLERHVAAMVRRERGKTLDAATGGTGAGMAAGERRTRGLDVARGAVVARHEPSRAGVAREPAGLTAGGRR